MKIDALQKYQNQLLSAFNAEQLQYLKYDNWTGLLTETDRLYATMFHDWDVLQKDSSDLAEAVQSLEWTVAPYVADGKEADAKAQEVAKTVTDALWKRSSKLPGTYSHTFPQLLNALVHALFRGFNVHEIEWVNDGELVYPAAFHQLPPQFMRWEDRAGELDRLLFVADGETAKPKPFPANKYVVALNTSGPDHPLYNAMYYSLIAWYGAYKFGLGWFMEYCQKYGMPKLVFHYESDRDRQQLEADLAEERVLNNILLKGDRGVDIANAPASGASLPQRELLNLAESQCHKLILGQTLTSDTSEHGGSLAQARVHAGVQAEVVKKRAAFVADVLNTQLIPAIVLLNYGTTDVPMPELVFKLPQEGVTLERVQVLKTALEIKGMRIKKSEAYEFMGFAQPAEGDDVFEAVSETPQQGGFGTMFSQQPPPGGKGPQKGQQKPEDGKKDDAVSAMNADFIESANPYGCNQYGHEWKSKHGENWKPSGRGVNEKQGEKNTENKEPSLQELQAEIDNLKKQVQEGKIKSPAPGSPEYEELKKDGLESRDAYYKLNRRKEEIEKEIESIKRNEKAYKDAGQEADYNLRISTMENALKKVNAEMEANRRNSMKKMIDVFKKVNSDVATTSRSAAPTDPAQEWLAPIKQKFLEARKAGASMADLKQMLLTMHPDTKALAKAFANNILAGFAGESDEITAQCNQYKHDDDCDKENIIENSEDERKYEDSDIDLNKGFFHPSVGKTGDWQSLGLEKADEMNGEPASKTAKGQELAVIRMLQKNNIVNSVDGHKVKFGPALLTHWIEKAKSETDKMGRIKHIRDAVRAVYAPHEIWEQADKQRTYFRVYKDDDGSFYMAGFVVDGTDEVRSLLYTRKKGTARSQRKGTLRYKR